MIKGNTTVSIIAFRASTNFAIGRSWLVCFLFLYSACTRFGMAIYSFAVSLNPSRLIFPRFFTMSFSVLTVIFTFFFKLLRGEDFLFSLGKNLVFVFLPIKLAFSAATSPSTIAPYTLVVPRSLFLDSEHEIMLSNLVASVKVW